MTPHQVEGMINDHRRINPRHFILEIYSPSIANQIKPGQFVMLKVSEENSPLLRRPFSVYKSYSDRHTEKEKRGHLSILYKQVGIGTQKMTLLRKGQKVNLIGPLGNGFTLPPLPSSSDVIIIGGGVGIVSLCSLLEPLKGSRIFIFIGGKTKDDILCVNDFKRTDSKLFIATEDGGLGTQGTVLDLYGARKNKLLRNKIYYIYACGPIPMLKSLAEISISKNLICQVSLESRMGCGFGACWGCVVKTKYQKNIYQRVCQDGPVFPLENILWDS